MLQELKKLYPYIQDETNLKNALITVREREGIEGDFSEEYAEIDKFYRTLTEEEVAESYRKMKERFGIAEEDISE